MDFMKDALKKRKSNGFEISITVEPSEGKDSDMAPVVKDKEEMPDSLDGMVDEMESPEEFPMDGMSDYDKESLMARKPKSLVERAAMEAMKKKEK